MDPLPVHSMSEEALTFERPTPGSYGEFYHAYIELVPDGDMRRLLPVIFDANFRALRTITPEQEQHRYAAGKWSIREVVGHLSDAGRSSGHQSGCIWRTSRRSKASAQRTRKSSVPSV